MMTNPNPPAEQSATPALAEMSLAEYRASRDAAAVTPEAPAAAANDEDQATAGGDAGETAADVATADDPEETDEASSTPDTDKSGTKPAKKGGFQRKLERQQQEIDELKRQLANSSARPSTTPDANATNAAQSAPSTITPTTPPAAAAAAAAPEKPKPKLEDFDDLAAYTEALTDWKLEQRETSRKQAEAQQRAQQAQAERAANFQKQAEAAKTKYADFDQVISSQQANVPPAVIESILDSEHGAEIAYTLAKDPSELARIAALAPLAAAKAIGKLEAQFDTDADSPAQPKTRTVSNAPAPIRPVGGRASSNAAPPDLGKVSLADYRRLRDTGRLR